MLIPENDFLDLCQHTQQIKLAYRVSNHITTLHTVSCPNLSPFTVIIYILVIYTVIMIISILVICMSFTQS
jgi:hypothetical protein